MILQRQGDGLVERFGSAVDDVLEELEVCVSTKGPAPRKKFVQHHAEREHVAARVERLPRGLLGRHVSNRSDHHSGAGQSVGERTRGVGLRAFNELREPEVGELGVAVPGHQDVGGLDVAVQNPRSVRRGQRVGHAGEQFDDLVPGALLCPSPVAQGASVHELRDEVLAKVELAHVEHGQDVRVVQR